MVSYNITTCIWWTKCLHDCILVVLVTCCVLIFIVAHFYTESPPRTPPPLFLRVDAHNAFPDVHPGAVQLHLDVEATSVSSVCGLATEAFMMSAYNRSTRDLFRLLACASWCQESNLMLVLFRDF